jgi:hypothetical protein
MPEKKTLIKIVVAAVIAALAAVGISLDVPDKVIDSLVGSSATIEVEQVPE